MSHHRDLDATVAVCTRDRPAQLKRLLGSLCRLDVPPATAWEVLVVDNGSTRETGLLVERYANTLPLRCVNEPQQGISHARNRAITEARGSLIMFTDDDCVVPEDWLARFLAAAARYRLADLFAGEIEPHFDGVDEVWSGAAREEAPSAFAHFQFGAQDIRIDHGSDLRFIPYGANFAVRTKSARKFRFDTVLGRGSHNDLLLGGEETKVFLRMLNGDHVGWLVAGDPVEHRIPAERATLAYIARYYFGVGLQWGQVPKSPAWINTLRRAALDILCRLAPHLLAGRDPPKAIALIRDWNMARGALHSHTLDKQARMVDKTGKMIF